MWNNWRYMLGYINVNDQEYFCCVGTTIYVFMCDKALLGGEGGRGGRGRVEIRWSQRMNWRERSKIVGDVSA